MPSRGVSSFSSSSRQEKGQGSLKLPEKLEAGVEGESQKMQARQAAIQGQAVTQGS